MALTKEQRALRKNGLGGSDCAAILGISKWGTPRMVYEDKINPVAETEKTNPAFERGNKLEPIILAKYEMMTGKKVKLANEMFTHPQYPFLFANIDGFVESHNSVVEAKSTHIYSGTAKEFGAEGTNVIPAEYNTQTAHYTEVLAHLGVDTVDIPVAFVKDDSGTEESIERIAIYHYKRDLKVAEIVLSHGVHFWLEHVMKRIPPELIELDHKLMAKRGITGATKVSTPEMLAIVQEASMLKQQLAGLELALKDKEKQIKDYIGDGGCLTKESGDLLAKLEWRSAERFDSSAFKADYPDLHLQYTKPGNPFQVFKLIGEK